MAEERAPIQLSELSSLLKWLARALLWAAKWGFLSLVAVMTGFRLFAPETYWTADPGRVYDVPLAFFYAILLAIWLQR